VPSLHKPPALADAADLLSSQLRAQIRGLARKLKPHARKLERCFIQELRRLGINPLQRQTLVRITLGAAADLLAGRRPLAGFFEHIAYNGRRLAKLDLRRGAVVDALQSYDRLVAHEFRNLDPEEAANLKWVSEQLNFCIVLTLNNAFYQVREAETEAFYELFQAELESGGQRQLLDRSLATLARFCQADAGRLFLFDRERQSWLALAVPGPVALRPAADSRTLLEKLAWPRHIRGGSASERLLLDPAWRGLYPSCWSIPLISGAGVAGAMQFGFRRTYAWLPRELQLLTGAAELCLLASEKLRLSEDLAAREEQVRQLASHMVEIEERERRRISRELHDEAGQLLLCLPLHLDMIERSVPDASPELRSGLAEARSLIGRTVLEIRRLLSDLSPAVLEQLGLGAAVRQLVNRFRSLHRIQVQLHLPHLGPLPQRTELVVYRLVQECCSNIARHSSASNVIISLATADGILRLCVEDDGVGFHVEEAFARRESFGLAGMRERVALVGGRFQVDSRPGLGSTVSIELPLLAKPESEPVFQRAG
jgi:signal transduction histidine kinase